jgi:CHAT domain
MTDAISSRLASYRRTLDRQVLDETGALLDAGAALLAAASGPGGPSQPPLDAVAAVGLLHSYRVRDRDDHDAQAALAMFAFVGQADPCAVPAEAGQYRRRDAWPGRAPDMADCLGAEQAVLRSCWRRTGEASVCRVMVDLARRAAEIAPPGHPYRGVHLSNLGASLGDLFQLTQDPGVLGTAIQASQEALALLPQDHLVRRRAQSNLAGLLRARFTCAGDRADLDGAVRLGQAAAAAGRATVGPELAVHQANLSAVLQARYAHTGSAADLEAAVVAARAAVAARGPARRVPARHWAALSTALLARFERYQCGEDVTAAIQAGRSAVAALSVAGAADPDRPVALPALCHALTVGCERGAAASDLAEAIERTREALTAVPRRGMEWVRQQHNLCLLLMRRFKVSGDNQDLDAAVRAGQAAVDGTPAGHPRRADCLYRLAQAYAERYEHGPDPDLMARDRARAAFREAALAGSAPARTRVDAAQSWGLLAAAAEDWADALSGYTEAVAALDTLGWHGPDRPEVVPVLQTAAALAGDAAAVALHAADAARSQAPPGGDDAAAGTADGLARQAVVLLERGRGIVLAPAVQAGADRAAVAAFAPDLGQRMGELRRGLDFPADVPGESTDPATAAQRAKEQRQELAGEWDTLVRQARQRPGLEHVFSRPGFAELSAAAADGPVVILNISGYRCDALIVTDGGLSTVPLDVTPGWVAKCADLLAAAVATQDTPGSRREAREVLAEVLGAMWDSVTGDVLERLGCSGPAGRHGRWPRLWWCLAGRAAGLPWHAAGHHPAVGQHAAAVREGSHPVADTVLDRVISSYTPTLQALAQARRGCAGRGRTLAVPAVPGPQLPDEAVHIAGAFQLAGGAHVIATQWRVSERLAPNAADHIYRRVICATDHPGLAPGQAAAALHEATRQLRDRGEHPLAWAPFVHAGP